MLFLRQKFKSEYRKNFQSFNKYDFDESKGVFEKRTEGIDPVFSNEQEIESPSSWYKEVVHLRKKANQYRVSDVALLTLTFILYQNHHVIFSFQHRGWGTELVPDHIAQLYTNQMMVWEQVSRRSSLSALSLASTIITKNRTKEEKEKENRRNSPTKSLSRLRTPKSALDGGNEKKNIAHVRNVIAKTRMDCSPDKGTDEGTDRGIKSARRMTPA